MGVFYKSTYTKLLDIYWHSSLNAGFTAASTRDYFSV